LVLPTLVTTRSRGAPGGGFSFAKTNVKLSRTDKINNAPTATDFIQFKVSPPRIY
jgi:hypothetical protein